MTMKINEYIPDNKVAIIGLEVFENMKELAQANEQKIEQLALRKLNEEMRIKGIDISVNISGVKEIVRHHAVIEAIGEFAEYHSFYPLPEQIRHRIVDAIVKEANRKLKAERDNIEKTVYEIYKARETKLWRLKEAYKYCALAFLMTALFILALLLMK